MTCIGCGWLKNFTEDYEITFKDNKTLTIKRIFYTCFQGGNYKVKLCGNYINEDAYNIIPLKKT